MPQAIQKYCLYYEKKKKTQYLGIAILNTEIAQAVRVRAHYVPQIHIPN